MAAVRIEVPEGVASPVWLAHVVRNAVQRALAGQLTDPAVLRVEVEDPPPWEALSPELQAKSSGARAQTKEPAQGPSSSNRGGAV